MRTDVVLFLENAAQLQKHIVFNVVLFRFHACVQIVEGDDVRNSDHKANHRRNKGELDARGECARVRKTRNGDDAEGVEDAEHGTQEAEQRRNACDVFNRGHALLQRRERECDFGADAFHDDVVVGVVAHHAVQNFRRKALADAPVEENQRDDFPYDDGITDEIHRHEYVGDNAALLDKV